jgi:hypothetical protein
VVAVDQKRYQVTEVGTIIRKDVDQKIAQFSKGADGKITAVITSANDTISTEYITKKILKKAIKKNEIKVTQYYYSDKDVVQKIAQFIKDADGKITAVVTFANDTISTENITKKILKEAVKKNEIKVTQNYMVENFITSDGKKTSKFAKVFSFYNYTRPMIIFTGLGILALLFAFLLKAEDKKKGYGLQMPNIKK